MDQRRLIGLAWDDNEDGIDWMSTLNTTLNRLDIEIKVTKSTEDFSEEFRTGYWDFVVLDVYQKGRTKDELDPAGLLLVQRVTKARTGRLIPIFLVTKKFTELSEEIRSLPDNVHFMSKLAGHYVVTEVIGHKLNSPSFKDNRKVFIVNGNSVGWIDEVIGLVVSVGLSPVVVENETSGNMAVTKKLERHCHVGFAIVLIASDDFGLSSPRIAAPQSKIRQNALLELGYLYGALTPDRILLLAKGASAEWPAMLENVVEVDAGGKWKSRCLEELKQAGLHVQYQTTEPAALKMPLAPDYSAESAVVDPRQHVFLSYAPENRPEVAQLRKELMDAGEKVWWDNDILPGQDRNFAIHEAIREAYAFVLCLSAQLENQVQSGVYPEVRAAIAEYRKYGPGSIYLLPVRLSASRIPPIAIDDTLNLDGLQHIDLFPATERAAYVQNLIRAIQKAPRYPRRTRRIPAASNSTLQTLPKGHNAPPAPGMTILFLAANPFQTARLDLEEELRALETQLEAVRFRDHITLIARHGVRPDDLVKYVREYKPNVVHFSGHGNKDGIILRSDIGTDQPVPGAVLARFFEGRGIDMVVLNACYSDFQAGHIQNNVRAVTGTTGEVDDNDARRFAIAFYRSLGNGLSVREALRDGSDSVRLSGGKDVFRSRGDLELRFVDPRDVAKD